MADDYDDDDGDKGDKQYESSWAVCNMYYDIMYIVGLVKPKTYDWKDSNLALFGSDLERKIKS